MRGCGEHLSVECLVEALRSGDRRRIGQSMHNRLEEPAERLSPWVGHARRALAAVGCEPPRMSGSGTSCFGLCGGGAQPAGGRLVTSTGLEPVVRSSRAAAAFCESVHV